MRIGLGYDVHAFGESRALVLGGVRFEGERGLAGHSDADALLHAVIDALLGAAGLGDIGGRFPPDDARWAGADSARLLADVAADLLERGLAVESLDSTVIAERPRLAERIPEMRQRIAEALGVDASRVNVKATTNERLGALGRGEGIAALAVVLLSENRETAA